MMLATNQAEGGRNNANPETVSVTGISMQMEFDGLVCARQQFAPPATRPKLTSMVELFHQGALDSIA